MAYVEFIRNQPLLLLVYLVFYGVPSVGGLSHNVHEYTAPEHLEAGASVLLNAVLRLADEVEQTQRQPPPPFT